MWGPLFVHLVASGLGDTTNTINVFLQILLLLLLPLLLYFSELSATATMGQSKIQILDNAA
jgi:predicted Na+-dependent transporter